MGLQGSVRETKTNQEHLSLKNEKKIKNSQPQTKFTGSYKKKSVKNKLSGPHKTLQKSDTSS